MALVSSVQLRFHFAWAPLGNLGCLCLQPMHVTFHNMPDVSTEPEKCPDCVSTPSPFVLSPEV